MKALAQFGGFVAVSAALHLAVWAGMPEGGAEGSGAAGDTRVSLQGASGELEALVREWLEAPEPQLEAEAPLPPQAVDAAEQALSRPDAGGAGHQRCGEQHRHQRQQEDAQPGHSLRASIACRNPPSRATASRTCGVPHIQS